MVVAGAGGCDSFSWYGRITNNFTCSRVPIETKKLKGLDSLLSMVQMPKAVPVGCLAIDGAFNAGLLAASIISNFDMKVKIKSRKVETRSNTIYKKKT